MKRLIQARNKFIGLMLAFGLVAMPLLPVTVSAAPNCIESGSNCITSGAKKAKTSSGKTTVNQAIKNITNMLLFLIGAVSVIMLIIGGFRYVTSNGNAEQIKAGKNTIMYAVIGLVVAIMAYAIVAWVVDALI